MKPIDCLAAALVAGALAASVAFGEPCARVTYVPAPAGVPAAYVAPAYHAREILFADAQVPLFDDRARDTFTFYGPPAFSLPVAGGPVVGTDGAGKELALAPARPTLEDGPRDAPVLSGYESPAARPSPAASRARAAPRLPALAASCFDCHGGGKSKGGLALFDPASGAVSAATDWVKVEEEISAGRMPPPAANKPAVSAADLALIRRLAGKK
jgi:hypothetical protein